MVYEHCLCSFHSKFSCVVSSFVFLINIHHDHSLLFIAQDLCMPFSFLLNEFVLYAQKYVCVCMHVYLIFHVHSFSHTLSCI
jgi:hypothetical protein